MDQVVNVKLLSHPANWLIVWVVLLFAGVAYSLVHKTVSVVPSNRTNAA